MKRKVASWLRPRPEKGEVQTRLAGGAESEPCGLDADRWVFSWGCSFGSLVCISPDIALTATDEAKGLSPQVARHLRWLPEDTETLIVARSVTLPGRLPDKPQDANWLDFGLALGTGDLDLVDGGKYAKPLRGRKIACIVSGAKNFGGVSSFGSSRSERCNDHRLRAGSR